MPIWGRKYFLKFFNCGLPSILGQKNLEKLSQQYEFHMVFLSMKSDKIFFYKNRRIVNELNKSFKIEFIFIDDIIRYFNNSYGMIINVSLFRGMLNYKEMKGSNYFVYLVADYVLSENILTSLLAKIENGANVIFSISLRCLDSSIIPLLHKYRFIDDHKLKIPERDAAALGLATLHPSFKAKIHSDFPVHSTSIQHIYWRPDPNTLIAKCLMLHPLVIRPTKWVEHIPGQADYAFVPALAPDGPFDSLSDSDDGVFLELQFNPDHEGYLSKIGERSIEKDSIIFSKWATEYFQSLGRFNFVVHSQDIPKDINKYFELSYNYIKNMTINNKVKLQSPYSHFDWIPGLANGVLNIPPEVSKNVVYELLLKKYFYYRERFKTLKSFLNFIDGTEEIKEKISNLIFNNNNLILMKNEGLCSKFTNEKLYKNNCKFLDIDILLENFEKNIPHSLPDNSNFDGIFFLLPMRDGYILDVLISYLKEFIGNRSFSIILFREQHESPLAANSYAWVFPHVNFKNNKVNLIGDQLIIHGIHEIKNKLRNTYFDFFERKKIFSIFRILLVLYKIIILLPVVLFSKTKISRKFLTFQRSSVIILQGKLPPLAGDSQGLTVPGISEIAHDSNGRDRESEKIR